MIDNSLFYTCSLIEYIGREKKLRRGGKGLPVLDDR